MCCVNNVLCAGEKILTLVKSFETGWNEEEGFFFLGCDPEEVKGFGIYVLRVREGHRYV